MTPRQIKLAETKARNARYAATAAACADEIGWLNAAIRSGVVVRMPVSSESMVSGYFVRSVSPDMIVTCGRTEHADWITDTRAHLANDGRWAYLMAVAGLKRHPLFADHTVRL